VLTTVQSSREGGASRRLTEDLLTWTTVLIPDRYRAALSCPSVEFYPPPGVSAPQLRPLTFAQTRRFLGGTTMADSDDESDSEIAQFVEVR
jgi:hypothetical protein